ncbi:MAG: hypothetical protein RL497_467 [Pseudomonadota bacterium]|jgi:ABC-2 type transport system ATP-binding protein
MIHLNNLEFGYTRVPLYQGLNLDITSPGVYGLFGRNGSGKSTLLKLLTGLLFPTQGHINVLGYTPAARLPGFLEQIYMVPEEFHLPNITLKALQNSHAPFYPRFSAADFQRYCDLFELKFDTRFQAMSLGQKKKSVMAFALASHTPLLVMDEPTNGLDIIGRDQFKRIMSSAEQQGRTVLISTHQAHDLQSLINHILFFEAGKLVLFEPLTYLQHTLQMGVTPTTETMPECIYQEAFGEQTIFVAANNSANPSTINLEWLYKALSLNQAAVLNTLKRHPPTKEQVNL